MNSVQQTILGLVLVGVAFVFGSYLHRDDANVETATQQAQGDMEKFVWQGNQSTDSQQGQTVSKIPSSSMPTFKPGNRAAQAPSLIKPQDSSTGLVEASLVPDFARSGETPPLKNQFANSDQDRLSNQDQQRTIAEPDFSRFSLNEIADNQPEPHPDFDHTPPPMPASRIATKAEIATPDFDNHFPGTLEINSDDAVPMDMNKETNLLTLRRPDLADQFRPVQQSNAQFQSVQSRAGQNNGTVSQTQTSRSLDLDTQFANPPAPSNQRVTNRQVKTQSNVVAVRPRNRSPVMLNATEFNAHRTVRGDTLQDLAVKYFGDPDYYLDIYVANQHVLENPTELPMGIDLRIPVYNGR